MAGTIISGSHLTGIVLNTPATENPATIAATGYITNTTAAYGGDAVFGLAGTAWQVTNLGTIKATGTNADAIFLSSGGSVTNGSSSATAALIDGVASGVVVSGAAGTVVNYGTIEGTGTVSQGIILDAGGTVTNFGMVSAANGSAVFLGSQNLGAINNFGTIESAGSVVATIDISINAPGVVNNFGTIENAASVGPAIYVGGGSIVTNGSSASTKALISSVNGSGVLISGTLTNPGTVDNFGTIAGATAVNLQKGGSVTNGRSSATTALIEGYQNGVFAGASQPGTITNFGTISATGTSASAPGTGIALQAGGAITNGSTADRTAVISSAQGIAISIGGTAGGSGTVTNFGTIATTGTAPVPLGPAIYLGGGGTITNYGLIKGAQPSTGGSTQGVITTHRDYATIRNFGTIASTNGNDAIHLDHGGTIINGSTSATNALISGLSSGIVGGNNPSTGVAYGAGAGVTLLNYGTIRSTGAGLAISLVSGGAVTNFGRIQDTSTVHGAVYSGAGGSVTNGASNATTALISAAFIGVNIKGAAGTITNFGRIQDTGTANPAVHLTAGGRVSNGSSGSDAALIKGTENGVVVSGGIGTVINFGTIDGVSGQGIYLGAGGTVTNHGLIEGGADGIYLGATTSAGHIVNSGTVRGKVGLGVAAGNMAGNALTNSGRITGTGGIAVQFGTGNDVLTVDAGAVFSGAVNGGVGKNKLVEGAPGTLAVTGFTGFETIVLADGGSDRLTLKSANFTGVTGNTITIEDGNMGNTVSAAGEAAADRIVVHAGAGLDLLTGGPGSDVFYAGGDTTMTGGLGTNEFIFSAPGGNTIEDFAKSSTNRLVFSNSGFDLGLSGGATPKQFTAAEAAALFTANPTGTFANTSQRLAYDTSNGELFSGTDGSGSSRHLVATFSDHASISTSQLFYIGGAGGSG